MFILAYATFYFHWLFLVTDGTKNACSFLYAAAARICKEMGFWKIQTYILEEEPGTSLKAAGWKFEALTAGGDWNASAKYAGKRRVDQPMCRKGRWARLPALGAPYAQMKLV